MRARRARLIVGCPLLCQIQLLLLDCRNYVDRSRAFASRDIRCRDGYVFQCH
jgi:hypothetical protein